MKFLTLVLAALVTTVSIADIDSMRARAPRIAELKDQGAIGEQPDGYLGVIKPGGDAQSVVDAENADRKAEYSTRAKSQGQSVEVLARVLGEARIRQEKDGRMIRKESGGWSKK